MTWWLSDIIRRMGAPGAAENARAELEKTRYALARVDALARRHATPIRPTRRRIA